MTTFQHRTELHGAVLRLHLAGEFDLFAAESLAAAHAGLLAHEVTVIDIECAEVTFFDCSALGALIELGNRAKALGRPIRLRSVPSCMRRVLALTAPHSNLELDGTG